MRLIHRSLFALIVLAAAFPATAAAAHHHRLGGYSQRNLVADTTGAAELKDPSLVNAWGLSFGPVTPAWVADNGTGVSTLYRGATTANPGVTKVPLTVTIPGGAPTGTVFNPGSGFDVNNAPSLFLFDSEAGVISGWNTGMTAQVGTTVPGAIFKGLAIADTKKGQRLYATDFHNGRVDVFDEKFMPAGKPGAFTDHKLPKDFAPFGIQTVAKRFIVVTYAKQDADAMDELHGAGLGRVDIYNRQGRLLRRIKHGRELNAPWGIALAPKHFGRASGDLLIGNFGGQGHINAFNRKNGRFVGALRGKHGRKLAIDGLWALEFGNGVIGNPNTLLFTAGPNDEMNGLLGAITH
jgi:uncharacterized protein (TIGR03118 family)